MTEEIDLRATIADAVGSPERITVVPNRAMKRSAARRVGEHKLERSRCQRSAQKRGVRKVRGQ